MFAWDLVARIILLPILAVQGVMVRRRTLVLPEADGARRGTLGNGPALRLLTLGDSSGAGVGVAHQSDALSGQTIKELSKHFEITWILIAKSGATTKDAQGFLEGIKGQHFDITLVVLGVNDAVRFTRIATWQRRQAHLRQVLREEFGVKTMLLTAVPPLQHFAALPKLLAWVIGAHSTRMDEALKRDLQAESDAHHLKIDIPFERSAMAADGYHPSANTYALWGHAAAQMLIEQHSK